MRKSARHVLGLAAAISLTFLPPQSLAAEAGGMVVMAQMPGAPDQAPLDARAVVTEVRRIIAERYAVGERRPALDAVLAEGLASGRYNVTNPATLAERINADLEAVGRDAHLNFAFNPRDAAIRTAQRAQPEQLDDAAPAPTGFERQIRNANHGVTELRLLPGNIRYMAYDGFFWMGPETAAALETAMRFLVGGDAIIIDLRDNRGGDSDASQFLISHFLPAGQPLYAYFREGREEPTQISTLEEAPAGRVIGKPLYLLTSSQTVSAAEEFTGNVAGFRLGEVVGENTTGGEYPADLVPIDGRFVLSVSIGRVVLASTGQGWEGVGIAPTIPTAAANALDVAHAHALRRLAATAPADERGGLEAMAEGIAARVEPGTPALPLPDYVGGFGQRMVSLEDGKLYYQNGQQSRRLLVPLGGDLFAFGDDPMFRVRFVQSGEGVVALEISEAGNSPQGRYERMP